MRQQSTWGRRTFTALLASGVAMGAATFTGVTAANAEPVIVTAAEPDSEVAPAKEAVADTLESHDIELLARGRGEGRPRRHPHHRHRQGRGVRRRRRCEEARRCGDPPLRQGRLRTGLRAHRRRCSRRRSCAGIAAIDLDETVKVPDPAPETLAGAKAAAQAALPAGPGPSTPASNPYMPTNEIGAVDFKAKHPTWDGRGVTIGIMDSGVDLDNPALQTTTTGERKIVDWVTATDPVLEGDATWRPMLTEVAGPSFTVAGGTWKAPAGKWRFNRVRRGDHRGQRARGRRQPRRRHHGRVRHPLRPGQPRHPGRLEPEPGLHRRRRHAAVQGEVRRRSLRHRQPGDRDPRPDAVRRRVPRGRRRRPCWACPSRPPTTSTSASSRTCTASHVAGIAAGNDMLGNPNFDGVAPGAKIVSSRACSWGGGCTDAALTTGMVDLVVNRKVDVSTCRSVASRPSTTATTRVPGSTTR